MMRRMVASLLVLAMACSDDSITGDSTTTGAYTLRTVNGSALPYTVDSGTSAGTVIVDETISLYQGGTFAWTSHFRASANGALQTRSETGAYTLLGTSITLRVNETGLTKIAIGDGVSMTIVEQGLTMVYRK